MYAYGKFAVDEKTTLVKPGMLATAHLLGRFPGNTQSLISPQARTDAVGARWQPARSAAPSGCVYTAVRKILDAAATSRQGIW